MSPVPVSPRRVFGVDFSAAADAGRHIWVCRAHPGSDGIRVESVDPLCDLPGGASPRDQALRSLVQKIAASPRSAWGFDFSFGLPRPLLAALAPRAADYDAQLEFLASLPDADAFRDRCGEAAPSSELRRRTDDDARTPFSPYNLRVYKQTYHGVNDVLRPLRGRPEVAVLPFDAVADSEVESTGRLAFNRAASDRAPHVYLMEVCPASLLRALEYPVQGYKHKSEDAAELRRTILRRLIDDGYVRPLARALRERVVEDAAGDALDSILAAVAAWRGYRHYDHARLRADPSYGFEGFVYT